MRGGWMLVVALGAAIGLAAAPNVERDARALEDLLMAPCCFRQQVSVHQSPTATEVRRDIRARLTAGATRQQVLDAYVAMHGAQVLAVPPARGRNLALYVLPPLVLAGSLLLIAAVLRRFTVRGRAASNTGPAPHLSSDPSRLGRLDDELRDLD